MTDKQKKQLLYALQRGIPLSERPFAVLADQLSLTEAGVVAALQGWLADGCARRFGGVFDARRLGYRSVLCAVDVAEDRVDAIAPVAVDEPGVTHCYLRAWPPELSADLEGGPGGRHAPNLWFTYAALPAEFDAGLERLRDGFQPHGLLLFPALRRFKIDVVFDTRERDRGETFPGAPAAAPVAENRPREFTEQERQLVRVLAGSLDPVVTPFEAVSAAVGMPVDAILSRLRLWRDAGVLRRLAVLVRHHQIGFKANGMCVWPGKPGEIIEAGRALAAQPEVTHCYQRPRSLMFPYDLYAMIHTGDWESTRLLFLNLSERVGLTGGRLLCSVREFKKTSMTYFG